jgi:polygalacturonase
MSKTLFVCFVLGVSMRLPGATFDVRTFGAQADGKTADRDAINKAIEAASASGGGIVHFPAGTYLTGSIRLKSNITLEFERGAILEASPDPAA